MQEITFGQLLEHLRISNNFSKTAISRGICSVSSLSRYEEDLFLPDKFTSDYILERLGVNPAYIDYIISDKNYYLLSIQNEIRQLEMKKSWAEIPSLLETYQTNLCSSSNNLHEQFILFHKSNIQIYYQNDYETALDTINEALSKTGLHIDEIKNSKKLLLSSIELELLINSIRIFSYKHDLPNASLVVFLHNYLSNLWEDNFIVQKYLPKVLYYLALSQADSFELKQSRENALKAQEMLIKNCSITGLRDVLLLLNRLDEIMNISSSEEICSRKQILVALDMLENRNTNYLLSEKSIQIWENIRNQALFQI